MPPIPLDNPVRQALLSGQTSVGSWCCSGNPMSAEVLSLSGMEWVLIDIEHYPIDLQTLTHCIRAIDCGQAVPMVRLPASDPVWIKHCLDAGALGLVIPQIRSADQVRQLVQWTRFPPLGQRPYGRGRAGSRYENYLRSANEHILLLPQIETTQAVDQLDDILAVEGYDGCFVGPTDLSLAFGWPLPSEAEHGPRNELIASLARRISASGKIAATVAGSASDALELIQQGYTMVSIMSDLFMIQAAHQYYHEVQTALQTRQH